MLEVMYVKKRFFMFIALVVAVSVFIIPLIGCNLGGMKKNTTPYGRTGTQGQTNIGQNMQVNPPAGTNIVRPSPVIFPSPHPGATILPTAFDRKKADNIRNHLLGIRDIHNVNVIVYGNMALVGYAPVKAKVDTTALKNIITAHVKQADKSITNVTVTSTPNLTAMIKKLSNDVLSNKPAAELRDSYTKLMQSLSRIVKTK
jgi:hypothetical protein